MRTFAAAIRGVTDLVPRANVDAVVRRTLTGPVTEEMQRHYSTSAWMMKRAAVAGGLCLVPPEPAGQEGAELGASSLPPKRAG